MACNGLKEGSLHLLVHPKWSRIIFGKVDFWPIFDLFLVAKQSVFKASCDFLGPKWLAMGSKWAHSTFFGTQIGLGYFLEKHIFDPVWTHFLSQNSRF